MDREPLAIVGIIVAIVEALLYLLIEFGLDLTESQMRAILVFLMSLGPLITIVVARSDRFTGGHGVWAPASVEEEKNKLRDEIGSAEAAFASYYDELEDE